MSYHDPESYQTKRRRVRSRARGHVDYIFQEHAADAESETENTYTFQDGCIGSYTHVEGNSCDAEQSDNFTSNPPSSRSIPDPPTPVEQSDSNTMFTDTAFSCHSDCEELNKFFQELDSVDAGQYNRFESDSEAEYFSDEESSESRTLISELAKWATDSHIPVSALAGLLNVLRRYHPSLPKDPRTLLKTPRKTNLRDVDDGNGGYYHFGVKESLAKSTQLFDFLSVNRHADTIYLQINIDGLPLFHSSCKQFWPILGRVCNPVETDPFVIGIYCGDKKPESVDDFLHDFVDEMLELQQGPVQFEQAFLPVQIKVSCFICDTPARAFVKQVKGHMAYFGCDKCTQKGTYDRKMLFPRVNSPLRTDIAFDEMQYFPSHCKRQSPLQTLRVGMISQFPLDYMHLVCLGVMRRLLLVWTRSPVSAGLRLSAYTIGCICENLWRFKSSIPREFSRKCRSLAELDRWKATEFRQFLLYSGIVALKGHLPRIQYEHFLLFFVAIFCLASPDFYLTHTDYAHSLLCVFVEKAGELYGRGFHVYNVHGLCHIAADVKLYGPLDAYSAFPFEHFLAQLKRLVRKPQHPLQQVVRRLTEKDQSELLSKPKKSHIVNDVPKGIHLNGPVLEAFDWNYQYSKIYHKGLYFSTSHDGNNCVQIGGSHFLIRNILTQYASNQVTLVVERFLTEVDFFKIGDSPENTFKSSTLGVVKVTNLAGRYEQKEISEIEKKCVLLPYRDSFVVVPLSTSSVG